MSLITYSEFLSRVRKQVFPDLDSDGHESNLEPTNLTFPHKTFIQNALITAQTYVKCLRQNNVNTYSLDNTLVVNCGVVVIQELDHKRIGAVYAYKPEKGCTRQHYTQVSVNKIMCWVDKFAGCECTEEDDICNSVLDGATICADFEEEDESDTDFLCEGTKIFAVGAGGKLYAAPRFPCGYLLSVHWEGIKYTYEDADLITDDPDLLDVVSTYLQAERARTFDRDLQLYNELLGKGPPIGGKNGSAFHTKLIAMAHRCNEETRIRGRACTEMWDDSAVSSENIGPALDPVPSDRVTSNPAGTGVENADTGEEVISADTDEPVEQA